MSSTATQCQFCWRVEGHRTSESESAAWWDLPTFIEKHNLASQDLSFAGGYCPQCTQLYGRLTQEHP